jgi:hypothetical protein
MKTVLVVLLLLTLGLNSFANEVFTLKKATPSFYDEEKELVEVCSMAESDAKGYFIRTFSFKRNPDQSVTEVNTVVDSRILSDKKKGTRVELKRIVPPGKSLDNVKFSGRKNKDKSKVLKTQLELCVALKNNENLVEQLMEKDETVKAAMQELAKMPQVAETAHSIGFLKGLSKTAYEAFLTGRSIGQIEGAVISFEQGFNQGAEFGFEKGVKLGIAGTLELLNRANKNRMPSQKEDGYYKKLSAPGTFNSNDGAFTRSDYDAEKSREQNGSSETDRGSKAAEQQK